MNDAQVQAQSCATPANDESVGVARTNAMLKQGDTFCVFELGSVPEGTKLYTRPQPAKVTQETAVVPDGLLDAVKEIAGSHTDNEITDRPVWWIIDPHQMMSPSVHEVYSMFKGPFFSREAATKYMEGHRYRYGKHVKVYCGSCNDAPQFKKLYDMSKAMLKGEK